MAVWFIALFLQVPFAAGTLEFQVFLFGQKTHK
jgi:hypothetical protein